MADTNFLKDNLAGSVPVEVANFVIKNVKEQAIALNICQKTEMKSDKKDVPVLSDTGKAYWVEEGEKISTSIHNWKYPRLTAKKLSVIIPVTEEKVEDSTLNVMEELKMGIADAFARAIDSAIFFGTESPFEKNLIGAIPTENKVTGTDKIDIDISGAMGKVENGDYIPTAAVVPPSMRQKVRDARDQQGNGITIQGGISGEQIYNTPMYYVGNKAWDSTKANAIVGDFTKALIGVRDDITYKVLDQATVGEINLAENGMVALRVTMRLGFTIADEKAFGYVAPKAARNK